MSNAISVQNISKLYRLGELGRKTAFRDLGGWVSRGFRPQNYESSVPAAGVESANDEFWALRNVSFDIKHGETVGVIGRNGAGKSTLLKILSRITIPTTGRISITGRMGSLLEVGTGFHPELSGRDNVYLNGVILGMSRDEVRKRFDEIVDFSELEQFIDTPVKRYSSGMRVRLAFSVAALLEPEILLLDEVLAVGDMRFQNKCLKRIQELVASGRTIILVAHSMGAIVNFCDRVIWLDKGEVKFDGEAEVGAEQYRKEMVSIGTPPSSVEEKKEIHIAERTGAGDYHIQHVSIVNDQGKTLSTVECGSSCAIKIDYKKMSNTSIQPQNVIAAVIVHGEQSERVFGSTNTFTGEKLLPFGNEGTLYCKIPRLPLLPGDYSLRVGIKVNGTLMDKILTGRILQVRGGDFFGSGRMPNREVTPVCVPTSWVNV